MCGIAGYIGSRFVSDDAIRGCLSRMKNRGPDHAAYERHVTPAGQHVCLLHTRLSIIDLDPRSNQPFTIGDTTLIFNGEIYNYLELRSVLHRRGIACRTQSDTEVLLQYYRLYGEKCLDYFEGMWSFAVFDASKQSLFIARDRFAEKPLYILRREDGIYFGSEIKFLAALSDTSLRPNFAQLRRYLALGYKSLYKTSDTFFTDVDELRYAEFMIIGSGTKEPCRRKYWNPQVDTSNSMSLSDAIDGTRERLVESMRLRMRSDVPLAFCLSGGVDSASLVSIAAKVLGCRLKTFSIIDTDERYNEEDNIMATVRDVGCEHQLLRLQQTDFLARLSDLVEYHDAPVATTTFYVHSMISEEIRNAGYRVAFSGTSADELFTGYYDHFLLHLCSVRDDPDYQCYLNGWQRHIASFVRNPVLRDPDLYVRDPGFRAHVFDGRDEIEDYLRDSFVETFSENAFSSNLLRNRMMNELFFEATPVILHEDDLNSMRYSVENRSPFLDRRLFEFAYSIPDRHLIRDGYGKYILREAMAGILNDQVRLDRRKKGFNASINSLVCFQDRDVRDYLLDPRAAVFDLIRRDRIERLLDMYPVPNHFSKFLFSFINVRIFLQRFG